MSDVVERAKAALEATCECCDDPCGWRDMQFAEVCRGTDDEPGLVPELVAEIERLQRWHLNQADHIDRLRGRLERLEANL